MTRSPLYATMIREGQTIHTPDEWQGIIAMNDRNPDMKDPYTRRAALKKMLHTGGGLALAAGIPDLWQTPELVKASLPAHAAASSPYSLQAYNTSTLTQDSSGYYQISASMTLEVLFTYLGLGAAADVTVWVADLPGNQYPNPILPPGSTGSDGLVQFLVTKLDIPYSAGVPFRLSVTVASPVVLHTVVAGTFVVS